MNTMPGLLAAFSVCAVLLPGRVAAGIVTDGVVHQWNIERGEGGLPDNQIKDSVGNRDGIFVNSSNLNGVKQTTTEFTEEFSCGSSSRFGGLGNERTGWIEGFIDQVPIYNRALKEDEIQQNFRAMSPHKTFIPKGSLLAAEKLSGFDVTLEELQKGYRIIKEIDPNHLVFVNTPDVDCKWSHLRDIMGVILALTVNTP